MHLAPLVGDEHLPIVARAWRELRAVVFNAHRGGRVHRAAVVGVRAVFEVLFRSGEHYAVGRLCGSVAVALHLPAEHGLRDVYAHGPVHVFGGEARDFLRAGRQEGKKCGYR